MSVAVQLAHLLCSRDRCSWAAALQHLKEHKGRQKGGDSNRDQNDEYDSTRFHNLTILVNEPAQLGFSIASRRDHRVRCGRMVKWPCWHTQSLPEVHHQRFRYRRRPLAISASRPAAGVQRQISVAVVWPTPPSTRFGPAYSTLPCIGRLTRFPSSAPPKARECPKQKWYRGSPFNAECSCAGPLAYSKTHCDLPVSAGAPGSAKWLQADRCESEYSFAGTDRPVVCCEISDEPSRCKRSDTKIGIVFVQPLQLCHNNPGFAFKI